MHEFASKILAVCGGKAYATALKKEITRLRKTAKLSPSQPTESIDGVGSYDHLLDAIGGKPKSKLEEKFRTCALWIDAAFHLIDSDYHATYKEREHLKASLLRGPGLKA